WHTYWVNPGTGLATTLTWALPPGWKASEILWPAPKILKDHTDTIIGNGYEGELFLPVTLTPPADLRAGDTVELKAHADWLMCDDVCVPGKAELALSLPVAGDAPRPDSRWGGKIRETLAALPQNEAAWKVTASKEGKNILL